MYPVDILDEAGKIIGSKPRYLIKKPEDMYHTTHIILITPRGELVMSTIPVREDLPNLYARKIGTTVATIRRTGETAMEAAQRSMSRELFIDEMPLTKVGERMFHHAGGHTNFVTLYYGIAEPPESFSVLDIESLVVITPRQFKQIVENAPEELAVSLLDIWNAYGDKLPL